MPLRWQKVLLGPVRSSLPPLAARLGSPPLHHKQKKKPMSESVELKSLKSMMFLHATLTDQKRTVQASVLGTWVQDPDSHFLTNLWNLAHNSNNRLQTSSNNATTIVSNVLSSLRKMMQAPLRAILIR